ncbi:MFS transporter [Sphingobium sp. DEHP117]|uniref:MFS transporter n=1 Tax=Sphingobium sp. DEHP117 TaxID=2993436 RepID=UPI0027D5C5CF|nr:MFS transporter [Sphingobium sp. DEHP117]MDQ4419303.1 MFS transporter [Sphingobium sp. DEHP117]
MTARQRSLALIILVIALVLEIVDLTIVNTALPAIQSGIGADPKHVQWIVAGYSLSFALLLMAGGRLGDSIGYRRVFIWGVAGFTLASAACGLARNGDELVAARLLQGATGAIMAPQALALLQVLFDPLERVAKMALFGVIGGLAAIAGPIFGGLLIESDIFGLGWRLVFLVNLPVGIIAIAGALRFLPTTHAIRGDGFDIIGTALFGAAVAALLWPLIGAEGGGGVGAASLASLVAVIPLCWLGWRHVVKRVSQRRVALFDPSIMAIPTFRIGLVMSVAFAAANAGFLLVFAYALQTERGQTPLMTAMLHMPFGFGAMFGIGVLSRSFLPSYGRTVPLIGAITMASATTLVLIAIGSGWSLGFAAPAMIFAGIGMGMTTGCIGPITFAQMDRDHAGAASGLLKTCQQLGSALGVAVLGSAYFSWSAWVGREPTLVAAAVEVSILLFCAVAATRLPKTIFLPQSTHPVAA